MSKTRLDSNRLNTLFGEKFLIFYLAIFVGTITILPISIAIAILIISYFGTKKILLIYIGELGKKYRYLGIKM